ncbi:hypothetical protein FRC03_005093, partial [Tulasnella sp. 419]
MSDQITSSDPTAPSSGELNDLLPNQLEGTLKGERIVHEGDYANIWRGKWWPPGASEPRDVAVKQLRLIYLLSDSDKELVHQYARVNKRLRREARAHVVQDHPRVVPLIGYRLGNGHHTNPPCLITPWYAGGDLKKYLKANPGADKLQLMIQAAEGLAHLHLSGTIHGDVRMENILVDEHGNAAIGDFGLAQIRYANRNDNTSGPLSGYC